MKRTVTITLDADTAAFLELSRAQTGIDDTSAFINTLLRHERFRQGYAARSSTDPQDSTATPLSQKYREHYGVWPNPHF